MINWRHLRETLSHEFTRDDFDGLLRSLSKFAQLRRPTIREERNGELAFFYERHDVCLFSDPGKLATALDAPDELARYRHFDMVIEPASARVFSFDVALPIGKDIRAIDVIRTQFSTFSPFNEHETYWRVEKDLRFAEGRRLVVKYTPRSPLQPLIGVLSDAGICVSAIRIEPGEPVIFIEKPLARLALWTRRNKSALATFSLCVMLLATPFCAMVRFNKLETHENVRIGEKIAKYRKLSDIMPALSDLNALVDASRSRPSFGAILRLASAVVPQNVELKELEYTESGCSLQVPAKTLEPTMKQAQSLGLLAEQRSASLPDDAVLFVRPAQVVVQ